ncbi:MULTISPECIES: hypothetical protein [Lactobacillus]|uniref:hypothetical protein n=1 Tax=Lactobacillus TaxID=1578 RepID=UPI001374834F|nr:MULTISPECIES: hypothetical protein [Lactobacillus]
MFEIYQFGYQAGFFDRMFLESQVQDGSLSEDDFKKIVGDNDATRSGEDQSQA